MEEIKLIYEPVVKTTEQDGETILHVGTYTKDWAMALIQQTTGAPIEILGQETYEEHLLIWCLQKQGKTDAAKTLAFKPNLMRDNAALNELMHETVIAEEVLGFVPETQRETLYTLDRTRLQNIRDEKDKDPGNWGLGWFNKLMNLDIADYK